MKPLPLTDRQVEVLELLSEGMVQKQVARHLHMSTETVKWHLTHARTALNARNTTHAVAIYLRHKRILRTETHTAQRAAAPLTPDLAGPRPTLPQRVAYRIIDKARQHRMVL